MWEGGEEGGREVGREGGRERGRERERGRGVGRQPDTQKILSSTLIIVKFIIFNILSFQWSLKTIQKHAVHHKSSIVGAIVYSRGYSV